MLRIRSGTPFCV